MKRQKSNHLNSNSLLTQCFVHCIYQVSNMIRKGRVDFDLAVKQSKMYLPEEYKDASVASVNSCRGVGKKV